MEVGVLWNACSAPDVPGLQSPGRVALGKGSRAVVSRRGRSAMPTVLVCPVESRGLAGAGWRAGSVPWAPLLTTLHSRNSISAPSCPTV